jgi:hypothetical protein
MQSQFFSVFDATDCERGSSQNAVFGAEMARNTFSLSLLRIIGLRNPGRKIWS